jgi:hypothetical protein
MRAMGIEDDYKAAEAFDASMTPEHRAAFARSARRAWLESGGTEETFRATLPTIASDISEGVVNS